MEITLFNISFYKFSRPEFGQIMTHRKCDESQQSKVGVVKSQRVARASNVLPDQNYGPLYRL
jgi:hypothetical protein